jgi:protein TonB
MTRYFLLFLLTIPVLAASGQDTSYYDRHGKQVTAGNFYRYSQILIRDPSDSNQVTLKSWYRSGKLKSVTHYSDYQKKVMGGAYEEYYEDGRIKTVANFVHDSLDGELKSYWDNGRLKRDDFFAREKLLRGRCLDSTGRLLPHTDWRIMAEFPGGLQSMVRYLSTKVHYPMKARKKGAQGEVLIGFVVEDDGRVDQVHVIRQVAPYLDAEAVKVVSRMPRWKPGTVDGQKVEEQYTLPIRFKLQP